LKLVRIAGKLTPLGKNAAMKLMLEKFTKSNSQAAPEFRDRITARPEKVTT
jgi:hypothetical protein